MYLTLLTLAAYRNTTVNTITRYAVGRDRDGNLKVCRDQNSGPIKDGSREIDRGIATTYGDTRVFLLLAQTNFTTKLAMTNDELNAFVGDMNDLHETGGEYTTVGYIDGRYAKAVFVATQDENGTRLVTLDGVQDFVAIDLERDRIGVRIGNQLGEMSLAQFTKNVLENTPIDFGDTPTIEIPEGAKLATYIDPDGAILLAYQVGNEKMIVRMSDGSLVLEPKILKTDILDTDDNVFVLATLKEGQRTGNFTAVALDPQSGEVTIKTGLDRTAVFEDAAAAK